MKDEVKDVVVEGLETATSDEARKEILRQALVLTVSSMEKASEVSTYIEAFLKNPQITESWLAYADVLEDEDLEA